MRRAERKYLDGAMLPVELRLLLLLLLLRQQLPRLQHQRGYSF
jgi:hypothetical protein